jgi:hypothetical protein
MREEKPQRTPPALTRCRQLAARSETDLKLTADAARAAGLPFKSLSKIQRARREVRDLLGEIEQHRDGELIDTPAAASQPQGARRVA